jgi:hypothetical protein
VILGGEDKTMWCRSIASGGITLETELPDDIWLWYTPPYQAPDVATTLALTFAAVCRPRSMGSGCRSLNSCRSSTMLAGERAWSD